ncbi:hypothetical protein HNQ91_002909 [Filimonas zeae]|uniref:Uncharacterized protein n=1 Tax=Filimonas zeae TaxID=1737353 RepID=A0A917IYE1_9BACT|nr:hypothetical protein [Filimonas zeae]MDR6339844.1 hypothetical protein [Filimonas zeae]GGH69922.1 hypothetical protein GCM10011379_27710 [Filimonas zeae]
MYNRSFLSLLLIAVLAGAGCRKTDFAEVSSPAYLRVFNSLRFSATLDNKDAPQPFLTMLIDPQLDANGIPESAATTGDFLETRDQWARPYPDAANTTLYQKEFPGTAKTIAAPILNGYDLSSWAQVPSGKHRVMFFSRPQNTTPFFNLDKNQRGDVMADTMIDLQEREVYTMQVLEQDYQTKKNIVYLRNETFVKQSLSDSLVYVNFYNLSSNGFYQYSPNVLPGNVLARDKILDTMNIFYSLYKYVSTSTSTAIKGSEYAPMGTIVRSQESVVNPYRSFPLFADTGTNRIYTGNVAQLFQFMKPGFTPDKSGLLQSLPLGYYLGVSVGSVGDNVNAKANIMVKASADVRSGLIISERSGVYNPRSFATVNTIEYINRKVYITTIQRRFDPPVY